MPVIFRAESDVFREAPFVDVMINPVNCLGTMGAGLAKEFSERHPEMMPSYKKLCYDGTMVPGYIQEFKPEKCNYTIINLPTKIDYRDDSDVDYIRKGLMALRRWLEEPGHKLMTVTMPMLGCGLGNLDQEDVKPLFKECLDDLPNIISVTQRAREFKTLPKVLVVFGSRGFANPFTGEDKKTPNPYHQDQIAYMSEQIDRAISEWGLEPSQFTAVMSGGAPGTDTAAAGRAQGSPTYYQSLLYKKFHPLGIPVMVAPADWERLGRPQAGFIRNRFMADIGTHFIGFKPDGVRSPGTDSMVETLTTVNAKLAEKYPDPKKIRFYKYFKVCSDFGSSETTVVL